MSRRVTTKTEITNEEHFLQACSKIQGVRTEKIGSDSYTIQVGRSVGMINLKSGDIDGDSDAFQPNDINRIRQGYAEEVYTWNLRRQGATIQSRTVNSSGEVVLLFQTTG